ncbi:hypothetical protein L9F63_013164, partial [Diploptera punctata]
MTKPPEENEPSYQLYMTERTAVLDSLAKRAHMVTEVFNTIMKELPPKHETCRSGLFQIVLALVAYTPLMNDPNIPSDSKERAREILSGCAGGSIGSYTDSAGMEVIRRQVARFIEKRDCVPCKWEDIMLFNGASEAIKMVLRMLNNEIDGKKTGMLIPIPTFPLYTASVTKFNMQLIIYYLDENK